MPWRCCAGAACSRGAAEVAESALARARLAPAIDARGRAHQTRSADENPFGEERLGW